MAKIGRNERCPCGSGAKFKRCCGMREVQAELDAQASALVEVMALPVLFPRLRPRGEAFGSWAGHVAAEQLDPPIEEGMALLEPTERKRIEQEHAREHPQVWRSLVDEVGDEELARTAVVRGAVVAGVWERLPMDSGRLAFLEEWPREDPAEALALVLAPNDLWSAFESSVADAALAELDDDLDDEAYALLWDSTIAELAKRFRGTAQFRGNWHDNRLAELVGRVSAQLPVEAHPRASAALARASEEFEVDAAVRERLAVLLLADSVCELRLPLDSALAA